MPGDDQGLDQEGFEGCRKRELGHEGVDGDPEAGLINPGRGVEVVRIGVPRQVSLLCPVYRDAVANVAIQAAEVAGVAMNRWLSPKVRLCASTKAA